MLGEREFSMNRSGQWIKQTDYGKKKRTALIGIIFGIFLMVAGTGFLFLSGMYFLEARELEKRSQSSEMPFDPWQTSNLENSWKTVEIIGMTWEFAEDFKGTYQYYLAFSELGDVYIVKMKGEPSAECQALIDYIYGPEDMEAPNPVTLRGTAAFIDYDIREFAIEVLNEIYGEDSFDQETFDLYIGCNILDTTVSPKGNADYGTMRVFLYIAIVLLLIGLVSLVVSAKARINADAELRKRDSMMSQAQSYWNQPVPDGAEAGDDRTTAADYSDFHGQSPMADPDTLSGMVRGNAPERKGNMFLGFLGAVGGSLLGVALWLILGQVGFIAGIAGFVMLKFALAGYQGFSGRLDKKGALLCLFIAAVMILAANFLDYGITICLEFFEYEASLDTVAYVAENFIDLMGEWEAWPGFFRNLIIGYGLSIWSSHRLIHSILSYKE